MKAKNNPKPTADDICAYEYPDGSICGLPYAHLHEVFFGSGNRQKSIQHGMQIRLCGDFGNGHHSYAHSNREYQDMLKRKYQGIFEQRCVEGGMTHTEARKCFVREFGGNYL